MDEVIILLESSIIITDTDLELVQGLNFCSIIWKYVYYRHIIIYMHCYQVFEHIEDRYMEKVAKNCKNDPYM